MPTNELTSVTYAQCADCGVDRRLACRGLCFSCYRRRREANDPDLLVKRRAQNRAWARRYAEARKLERFSDLIDRINAGLLTTMKPKLSADAYAQLQLALGPVLEDVLRAWYRNHERRLKLMLQIEKIESSGMTAVVIAAEDQDHLDLADSEDDDA